MTPKSTAAAHVTLSGVSPTSVGIFSKVAIAPIPSLRFNRDRSTHRRRLRSNLGSITISMSGPFARLPPSSTSATENF